ncbi:AAA family ATPase [Roseicyclus marinus]|uniref:AAA family ATPase n=1 Tax=Roseicyclus marinus TaxID=2161673 RepID=UPI00241052EE|nr:AAA family ATPase [Roseicyclus marinus]MDG3040474.1 AAA family ATPase [Roseicyclus marinus]
MPKPFDFAPGLRRPATPTNEIEKRLGRFLADLRRRKAADADAEAMLDPVSASDWDRIARRARKLHEAQRKVQTNPNLKKEDWEQLSAVFEGISLQGPATEHHANEIAADLLEEMPWMRQAIEHIWRDMRRAAARGYGLRFRPILLDGPPSVGKTHLARSLARLCRVPEVSIDIGAGSDGFRLVGSTRNWGRSTPGRVVETVLAHRVANPVVFVDEVEKAGVMQMTGGASTSVITALLGMIEPSSASRWECPYLAVKFDLSRVNWILASNDIRLMSRPLLSRCRVVFLRELTRCELFEFAERQIRKRGLDDGALENVAALMQAMPDGHLDLCLRGVLRIIDDLEALGEFPPLS